jgi:excisionase family DNA binding protein
VTCNEQETAHPPASPPGSDTPADGMNGDALAAEVCAIAMMLRELLASAKEDPDRLLTVEEVADLFQLSARTLKDRAAAGAIAHHRIGKHYRFSRADIKEFLSAVRQGPQWKQPSGQTPCGRRAGQRTSGESRD